MPRIISLGLIFAVSILFIYTGCASEPNFPPGLPSGEIKIEAFGDSTKPGARFDFSSGRVVYEPDAAVEGDIFFDRKSVCGSGSPLKVGVQDTQPQSIGADPSAPTVGYSFPDDSGNPSREGLYTSHVYWFKLTDGSYGKIKIKESPLLDDASDFEFVIFEWVYQPDGTENFKGTVEEEATE